MKNVILKFSLLIIFISTNNIIAQNDIYLNKETFKGKVKEVKETGISVDKKNAMITMEYHNYYKTTQFNEKGIATGYTFAHKNNKYKPTNTVFIFDKKEQKIKELRYCLDSKIENTLDFKYDKKGNQIESRYYIGNFERLDSFEKNIYDNNCNLIQSKSYYSDGRFWLGCKWIYENDIAIKCINLADNTIDLYEYDSFGNIISIKTLNDKDELDKQVNFTYIYDNKGNWIEKYRIENGLKVWKETREFVYY